MLAVVSSTARWTGQILAIGIALVIAFNSHAQALPDAGSALREVTPAPGAALPPTPRSLPEKPQAADNVLATGPTMWVSAFVFEGNKRYGSAELSAVLKSYLHRPLHYSDLEAAAAAITSSYRTRGWLARVLVPPQTI